MNVGVLCSGSGTNLQALLDAEATGALGPARIVLVVCNVPGAGAVERAERAGKLVRVLPHRDHADRAAFDAALVSALREERVELVVLAGFMRLLGAGFLAAFPDRVLNIHPALLPAFPGTHAQRQALEHGVRIAGCTVHLVDGEVDGGPIVAQAAVPVRDGDDEESLRGRILDEEHRLLPAAVKLFAEGRVHLDAPGPGGRRRVRIDAPAPDASALRSLRT